MSYYHRFPNFVFGSRRDDTLFGTAGRDFIFAGHGDDVIHASLGNDYIFGGRGFDTVVYEGSILDVDISTIGRGFFQRTVVEFTDGSGNLTRDTLYGIEALEFESDDYTLFLDGRNNAVLAGDDTAATTENAALVIDAATLLANDSEFDGDTISVVSVSATSAKGAAVSLSGGAVTYEPGALFDALQEGETATDTFTYLVDDGKGGTDTATVTVTITGENDAPVLSIAAAATQDENETPVLLTATATDVDSAEVTFALAAGGDNDLFAIDPATGELRFIAPPDFEAPADVDGDNVYDLVVIARDAQGAEASQGVTITVNDVSEIPTDARINEFHYDNEGGDVGEFIEIRVNAQASVDGIRVELNNGSNGSLYSTLQISTATKSSDGTYDYYVFDLPSNGIQNGSPDGIALIEDDAVTEFLSYEGEFTASGGTAAGQTSTDIGASESGSAPVGSSLQRNDAGTDWLFTSGENTKGAGNDVEVAAEPRINEFHYDNTGGDVGEFIEVRVTAGATVDGIDVERYNGSNGARYSDVLSLGDAEKTSDGSFDYYVFNLPANGLQNGSPDGFALIQDGAVVEFLSYEGSFTATDGTAVGVTSTDIGAAEPGTAEIGSSLQRSADGATWAFTEGTNTSGDENVLPVLETARINEFHYDNAGGDTGEFVEIRLDAGASAAGLSVDLYNGNGGAVYNTLTFDDAAKTSDGTFDYYVLSAPGIQNGSPDGLALVRDGSVVEFLSYEGSLTATDGAAIGMTSTDVGVAEPTTAEVGSSLQRSEDGATWTFTDGTNTAGAANGDGPSDPERKLIGEVQGNGLSSPLVGAEVIVAGIVTYVQSNGFYMQDEGDGDAATSDGIFVFTGAAPTVVVGDAVETTGSVSEFFDLTQISSSDVTVTSSGNALPAATLVHVGPDVDAATVYEAVEGMLVDVVSGTEDPLTVITNFNLDRFGEITVSAGTQIQPTQLFDAQTQAAEIADLLAENTANRLVIDDGPFGQNPDAFDFIPNTSAGDDGDGILDRDDDFSQGGTLRIGAEFTAPVTGIMSESFDIYRVLATETLSIDEETNSGDRESSPADPGGDLQVVSFNVLNYFTTLSGGTGPSGDVGVRGARSVEDLERQTDKIVAAMLETGGEVFALQELENNGFGEGSAIEALTAALNAVAGDGVYDFVNPFGDGNDGFIGTDAITTGLIYDTRAVTPVYSDFLVFSETTAAETFAIAEQLNPFVGSGDQLADLQRNRPTVVATFEDTDSKETFTVASSHFKSKGDSNLQDLFDAASAAGAPADLLAELQSDSNFDLGDGQAFWNGVRTEAANELLSWLETDFLPAAATAHTGEIAVGDEALLLGDFNAYAQEDPTQAVRENDDFVDLIDTFIGQEDAFSFIFDGQQGTLDQALGSNSIADNVTGVVEWHINAQEPDLLNYDSRFNDPGFYAPNVFGASDHDPLIVGLNFGTPIDLV